MTEKKPTLVELRASTQSGGLGLAAARLAVETAQLLKAAFAARKDIDQKELARIIGVSEGRVSQVLHGDGNVHVATLARYLTAMGYEAELTARALTSAAAPLKTPRRRGRGAPQRPSKVTYTYSATASRGHKVGREDIEVIIPRGESAPEFLTTPIRVTATTGQLERHSVASDKIRERSLAAAGLR